MFILKRYYKFYRSNGILKTLIKVFSTPFRIIDKHIYNRNKKKIFSSNSQKEKFELIYKNNFWSSKESKSGFGSEKINTVNKKKKIIDIINKKKNKNNFRCTLWRL